MLLSDRHAQYVYNALGNLTEKHTGEGVVYFAYDAENRLSKVTMPDGMVIEYGYDPMGRRVRRTVNGASTYFVMADEDMIAEFEGSAVGNVYIHGPGTDEPWALMTRKGTYYYHADGLGSIVAITDDARRVVQTYEYDFFGNGAFGGLHDMKNRIKQPYTFTGREFDRDTRLYYYRARYYDPSTGRFTQQDPIGYDGGLNLYAYVGGNPVNAVDPWGLIIVYRDDFSRKSLAPILSYLRSHSSFANSIITGLESSQFKYYLKANAGGGSVHLDDRITIDVTAKHTFSTACGKQPAPLWRVVAHELGHLMEPDITEMDIVERYENIIVRDIGGMPRVSYP